MKYLILLSLSISLLSSCDRKCDNNEVSNFRASKYIFRKYSISNEIEFICIQIKSEPKRIFASTFDGKAAFLEEGMCVGKENYCITRIGMNNSSSFDGFFRKGNEFYYYSYIVPYCMEGDTSFKSGTGAWH